MPRVTALYRYPVKGYTPEVSTSLKVLAEGRVAGDRVLGFRFANTPLPPTAWSKKYDYAVLVNTPGVARLAVRFDDTARRLRIALDGAVLADESIDEETGRKRIAAAVESFITTLAENPLTGHPERVPLALVGDGITPRYTDSERGEITLHSRESLAAVAAAICDHTLDEVRFRSNIAIEGVTAWAEQDWVGRALRIGDVEFDVVRPKVRCLATHANPSTGERDLLVMQTLVKSFQQAQPTFAVALLPRGAGGEIRVGDRVSVGA